MRRRHPEQSSRAWGYVLDRALRRPVLALIASVGLLVALALPALGLHTATPGATDLPHDLPVLQTYDRIQQVFPGPGAGDRRRRRRPMSRPPRCKPESLRFSDRRWPPGR